MTNPVKAFIVKEYANGGKTIQEYGYNKTTIIYGNGDKIEVEYGKVVNIVPHDYFDIKEDRSLLCAICCWHKALKTEGLKYTDKDLCFYYADYAVTYSDCPPLHSIKQLFERFTYAHCTVHKQTVDALITKLNAIKGSR